MSPTLVLEIYEMAFMISKSGLCFAYATDVLFSVKCFEARYSENNQGSGMIRKIRQLHLLVPKSQMEKSCALKLCQYPRTKSFIVALKEITPVLN